MTDLVVTIPLPSTWSLSGEWAARQALEDALNSTGIGSSVSFGTIAGEMHLSLRVADESEAGLVIARAVQKAMPGTQHRVRRQEELLWVRSFCPHTGIMQRHARHDGRCEGCGKVRPELIAPVSGSRQAVDDFVLANGAALGDRRLRLLACACCRRIWHLLVDPRSRAAVELAERYATGQARNEQLESAHEAAWGAIEEARSQGVGHSAPALMAAAYAVGFAVTFRRAEKGRPVSYDAQDAINVANGAARAAMWGVADCAAYDEEQEARRVLLTKLLEDATEGRG
jgi:hypothetical protein